MPSVRLTYYRSLGSSARGGEGVFRRLARAMPWLWLALIFKVLALEYVDVFVAVVVAAVAAVVFIVFLLFFCCCCVYCFFAVFLLLLLMLLLLLLLLACGGYEQEGMRKSGSFLLWDRDIDSNEAVSVALGHRAPGNLAVACVCAFVRVCRKKRVFLVCPAGL